MKFYKITSILLTLLVFSGAAFSRTLAEYKEGISHAKEDISVLIYSEDDRTLDDRRAFEQKFYGELPELIPAKEKIEIRGATVETNNQWIYDKFEKYKKNDGKETGESLLILNDVYERLSAVEMEIEKLENAAAAENTKDENKRKISEILKREEYLKPKPPEENFLQRTWRKIKEWLNEMFPKPDIDPNSTVEGLGSIAEVVKYAIYALIIGMIGFLIYKFLPLLLDKYKAREKRDRSERVILGEKLASDATAQSLFTDAEDLARTGDLRGAIRKGYIALLVELDDRKILRLSKHKTNRDYLRDVRERRELYSSLNDLTNNFERHWYGVEKADETDWEEFRTSYKQAVNESN